MFAVLHVPEFSLQALLRHEPEAWSRPVVLVDPQQTTPRVLQLTRSAREAGVAEGLTPVQALARCREVSVRHRSPAQEAAATEALLQGAMTFSPYLELTAPGTITLDARTLASLKGAEAAVLEAWAARLASMAGALNLRARVGTGPTPTVAAHAARWSESVQVVTDPAAFVASLPVAALEPSDDILGILDKWGIRRVGELLALGQAEVADRLGLEALALFAAASTTALRPLRLARPEERFEECFEFTEPVETLEPLLFVLRRFVDQLGLRLEAAGKAAARAVLEIRLEDAAPIRRDLRVPEPTRRADVLFRMLHTDLESLRTASAVAGVQLTLDPVRPPQRQFGLFEAAIKDPHQFQETLARLAALVGADRVGTPVRLDSHEPDAFRLVPPAFEAARPPGGRAIPALLRFTPLRRLRPGVPATVETAGPGQPPLSVRSTVANARIRVALGPVRSSGRWWESAMWEREEWEVETREGTVLRLQRTASGWTVEGVME